jgi:hypothetical protein
MGRLKEDKNYFNKVCLYQILLAATVHQRGFLSSTRERVTFTWEFLSPVFRKKKGKWICPPVSAIFQVFLAHSNPYINKASFGMTCSDPIHKPMAKLILYGFFKFWMQTEILHSMAPAISHYIKWRICLAWWRTSVIPALGKIRQEDCEFESSLGCIVRPYIKKKKKKKRRVSWEWTCTQFWVI